MASENRFSESFYASSTLSTRLRNKEENGEGENIHHAFTGLKHPWFKAKLRLSPRTLHDDGLNIETRKMKGNLQRNNTGQL